MRAKEGSVYHIAQAIEADLTVRKTGLQKPHIPALADLTACSLLSRTVNTSEWRSLLPRKDCSEKAKEHYISRFLANPLVLPLNVMAGFAPEVIQRASSNGQTVILMLDQSKIKDGMECLMVSLRVKERAIPIAWRVVATGGAIGFEVQQSLLKAVHAMIPEGVSIMLSSDRFYGTANMIGLCQNYGWTYRIRLKGNILLKKDGGEISTGDAARQGITELIDAEMGSVITNVGFIHESGHPEPWIIAMNEKPTKARTLDYGLRWGIESLFSDFKSRGFGITETHLEHAERIERLILILTLAIYWAVSTGMALAQTGTPIKKSSLSRLSV